MPQAPARKKGVTFVEMLVVLGLLSVISAILVPNYFRLRANHAVNVAEKLVLSDIKRGKDVASAQGSGTVTFSAFVPGGREITITGANGNLVWQDALPFGATSTTDWGNSAIVFSQNGTATLGGAAAGTITIGHPSASITRQIRIVPFTGAAIEL